MGSKSGEIVKINGVEIPRREVYGFWLSVDATRSIVLEVQLRALARSYDGLFSDGDPVVLEVGGVRLFEGALVDRGRVPGHTAARDLFVRAVELSSQAVTAMPSLLTQVA